MMDVESPERWPMAIIIVGVATRGVDGPSMAIDDLDGVIRNADGS
jgi:hypothetical protein